MTVSTLQALFAPVQKELAHVEVLLREAEPEQHSAITQAARHLLSSGGKRVRPALTLMVAKAFGVHFEKATALAAAVELLHTATLVHDDVIDGALLRRGNPTLNATWSPSATILTGDYFFARAASLAARTESVPVMQLFAKGLMTIVNGEITQLFGDDSPSELRETYYRRIYAKTASLFAVCAEAGAMLGNASEEMLSAMRRFGRALGMAFQIVDDVFDFIGSPEQLGKPVGDDLRRGLVTLPTIHFMNAHPHHQALHDLLNGNLKNENAIDALINEIRHSTAIEEAMGEARGLVDEGKQALEAIPDEPIRQGLSALASFIVERDR